MGYVKKKKKTLHCQNILHCQNYLLKYIWYDKRIKLHSWGLTYLYFKELSLWGSTEEVPHFNWIDTPDFVK